MLKWIGRLFIFAGIAILLIVGYLVYDFYYGSNYQLDEVTDYLINYGYRKADDKGKDPSNIFNVEEEQFMSFEDFFPEIGDVYGVLEIPSIQLSIPIIYGVEQKNLRHGVGHDPHTSFPTENKQIFLTGHNDSAFLKVDELNKGDEIFINTPYGRFAYVVDYSGVGHESETWRMNDAGEEELVLMTCYPLFTLTQTERRYFVYAVPLDN